MHYYMLYKPYGMLSQFSQETPEQRTLADLDFVFPKDVYPVGRLDADSEGLLLLTNDKSLNDRLLNPRHAHSRTYWVQVEGTPTDAALRQLAAGVAIRIKGKIFKTLPLEVKRLPELPALPERTPPVRFRKTVADSWLELRLTEGKNRQVRRMCAAVGFPVLRLVRVRMGALPLGEMQPGAVCQLQKTELDLLVQGASEIG